LLAGTHWLAGVGYATVRLVEGVFEARVQALLRAEEVPLATGITCE